MWEPISVINASEAGMSRKRTELFMTVETAALYLMKYGYKQDDDGEWYRHESAALLLYHARIERRRNGAAVVFAEPIEA